jgi:hypothetical protein
MIGPVGLQDCPNARRTPILVLLGFNAALLMAPCSALISVCTFVPEAERRALTQAAGLALGAILLIALTWRWLPWPIRVLGVLVLLMAGFALWMIGGRFLW